VIIFLLGAISVKALLYLHDRANLRVLRRPRSGTRRDAP
jgi:hypothetical protein